METSDEGRAVEKAFTEAEVHVLSCAMAGNFPPSLNHVRLPVLRKLAAAHGGPKARIARQQADNGTEDTDGEQ